MAQRTKTILLIEEEPALRDITAFRLELLGYRVVTKLTAAETSKWLSEELPDLAVIGAVAETNSLEFLNQLSNDPRTSEIPVVYLSTTSDLEDVQKAFNAGADEFLVSPYDPLMLETKVVGLIASPTE